MPGTVIRFANDPFLWHLESRVMKSLSFLFGLVVLGVCSGCWEKPGGSGAYSGPLFRHHFAGTAAIAQHTNSAKLKKIAALPLSGQFRDQLLQRFAQTPHALWRAQLPAATTDLAPLFRPLLDDLASAESFLEVRGTTDRPEAVLALQLNDARARLWETNLAKVMTDWKLGTPTALTAGNSKGWELKRKESPNLLQFVRAGQWVLVGAGHDRLTLLPDMLQKISQGGRPVPALDKSWLEIEADCPRLHRWFPSLVPYQLPPTHMTVAGRDGYLLTKAKLMFSENIPWKFEPWRIPTNIIRDPLISFTAGQGLAPLLGRMAGFTALGISPVPNQFYVWGQTHNYLQTFLALPVGNATNSLRQLIPKLQSFLETHVARPQGTLVWVTNRSEIMWRDLPFVIPTLRAARDGRNEYLVASVFPPTRLTNAPPAELFAQFANRTNLLYYDWELSAERVLQANQFYHFWNIAGNRQLPGTNAMSRKWIAAIAPLLDNSATEISVTSPKELTLTRKSDLGFTGYELVLLTHWSESKGFPLTFDPPPLMRSATNRPPANRPIGNSPTVGTTTTNRPTPPKKP